MAETPEGFETWDEAVGSERRKDDPKAMGDYLKTHAQANVEVTDRGQEVFS